MAFPDKPRVNLEDLQERILASEDPRGFLRRYPEGAIFDEIQNVPDLLSQIQVEIDSRPAEGRFILTGSNQGSLRAGIGQTLAGRTAIAELFPFTISELDGPYSPLDVDKLIQTGFYPRIWDKNLDAAEALSFYVATYVERDLRSVQAIQDLGRFQKFLALCAGRTGQLLNVASLAGDAGISPNTARDWISILEAGFIVFQLRPWHENMGKRLVKMSKLYFWDVGLASWLLGNSTPAHVATHPLRGSLFENLIIADTLKRERHRAGKRSFFFYRDSHGNEADLAIVDGPLVDLVEIKAGETVHPELWKHLPHIRSAMGRAGGDYVVHGGTGDWETMGVHVRGWREWMLRKDD